MPITIPARSGAIRVKYFFMFAPQDNPPMTKPFQSTKHGMKNDIFKWCNQPGLLFVKRTEIGTRAKIRSFAIRRAKGIPGAGAEDVFFGNVVHIDRYAECGRKADQVGAD